MTTSASTSSALKTAAFKPDRSTPSGLLPKPRTAAAQAEDGPTVERAPVRPTNPLGRHGHGSDIAYLTLFLCSPLARFVSVQVIAVDGAGSADMLRLQAGPI